MSRESLDTLLDYLLVTLQPNDMHWLGKILIEHSRQHESPKPYTKKEIDAMIDRSECDIAEGRYRDIEELFHEWDEEEEAIEYAAEPEPEYHIRKA